MRLSRAIHFRAGTAIFREGEFSGRVILIARGHVKVVSTTPKGREVVLAIRGPGELLGEFSAVDRLPHSATCVAMEAVDALVVSARDFRRFLDTVPGAGLRLLETVTTRLRDADRKRVEFGSQDALGRVAARLVELVKDHGRRAEGKVMIELAFSQGDLAAWIGASRESVVKALAVMRLNGWIETGRRRLVILDLAAIEERAA